MVAIFRKLVWTEHSEIKMRQYGLSKQKLSGILARPERREKGIAPGTTAVMRTNKKFGNKTVSMFGDKTKSPPSSRWTSARRVCAPGEIWIMYKDVRKASKYGENIRKIISAWRYPGITKPGEAIPIPDDIRKELLKVDGW